MELKEAWENRRVYDETEAMRINELERRINRRQTYIDSISQLELKIKKVEDKIDTGNEIMFDYEEELENDLTYEEKVDLKKSIVALQYNLERFVEKRVELIKQRESLIADDEFKALNDFYDSDLKTFLAMLKQSINKRNKKISDFEQEQKKHSGNPAKVIKIRSIIDRLRSQIANFQEKINRYELEPQEKRQKLGEFYFTELKVW
jgi:hypothetical protein